MTQPPATASSLKTCWTQRHNRREAKRLPYTGIFAENMLETAQSISKELKEASVAFCITNATILKVSSEELPIIADLLSIDSNINYKEFARLIKERYSNLRIIVITLGADGAYCYDCRKGEEYSCESQKVEVASTVGAGDSYSAAFLYQYSRKTDIKFCLEYASKIAGYVVSKYDTVPDYNINDFL